MKNKLTVFLVTTSLLISSATVVSGSHWSTGSINRLVSHGVLNDDINIEEIFANPNKEITRENFFYLMVSSLYGEQAEVMDHENFGDFSQVTKELTGYIVKAYEEGILFGVEADGKININPNAIITRQDAAAILGRALKFSSTGSPTFSDNMNIADYAKGYVAVAQEMGILNGYTDGSFKPLNSITWGEAVTIFASIVEDDAKIFSDKKELYAGTTTKGYIDEALLLAEFNNVKGISLGSNGSIYVADSGNNLIRVIKEGKVSTFSGVMDGYTLMSTGYAGYIDGAKAVARFNNPSQVAEIGGVIYVVDTGNHAIRAISGGKVTTYAGNGVAGSGDGSINVAKFNAPEGIVTDGLGNIYVADTGNNAIRKIDKSGYVTTYAGAKGDNGGYLDGTLANAKFNAPTQLAYADGVLYVSDSGNNRIRAISNGEVKTIAGSGNEEYPDNKMFIGGYEDGDVLVARFHYPTGICVGNDGTIYVADTGNSAIRAIKNGKVSTVYKVDEESVLAATERLVLPYGITIINNELYVSDSFRCAIYKITELK